MSERALDMAMTPDEALVLCHGVWDWSGCPAVIRAFGLRHEALLAAERSGGVAAPVVVEVDLWEPISAQEAAQGRGTVFVTEQPLSVYAQAITRRVLAGETAWDTGLGIPETGFGEDDSSDAAPVSGRAETLRTDFMPKPTPPSSPILQDMPKALYKSDHVEIGARMKEARKAAGWDGWGMKKCFGLSLGLSEQQYNFAEMGRSPMIAVPLVAKALNANPEWLRTGQGEMWMVGGAKRRGAEDSPFKPKKGSGLAPALIAPPLEALTVHPRHRERLEKMLATGFLGADLAGCLDRVLCTGLMVEAKRLQEAGLAV